MRTTLLAGTLGLAALAACGDGTGVPTGRVQVGVATDASAAATSPAGPLFADTYTDSSGNTLVLESASVVLRKIHLEGSSEFGCEDDDEGEGEDSLEIVADSGETEDACAIVKLGPVLVDLPLNGGVAHEFTVTVDTGTYTAAQIQIHKPTGAMDSAFLVEHPDYDGVSIRVTGTFNGNPFVFTTGVTDVQRVVLDPPVVVTDGGTTSLTVMLDLSGWFRAGGGVLIDPATAMGATVNAILVQQNIIRSLHGFEDEDHDGHPDD